MEKIPVGVVNAETRLERRFHKLRMPQVAAQGSQDVD
jgi:hypothetical protein